MHKYWPKEIGSNVDKMWGKEQKMSQDIKGTSRGQGVTPGTHVKGGDKKKKRVFGLQLKQAPGTLPEVSSWMFRLICVFRESDYLFFQHFLFGCIQ